MTRTVAPRSIAIAYVTCAMLLYASMGVWAFKAEDFKLCKDLGFCQRLRGPGNRSTLSIQAGSVRVEGAHVLALIENGEAPDSVLELSLSAHASGSVRLRITERGVARFEVPEVLVEEFASSANLVRWEVESQTGEEAVLAFSWTPQTSVEARSLAAAAQSARVTLSFSPPALTVEQGGEVTIRWNGGGGFAWEHARERGEEDPAGWWEERFGRHHDTTPHGPRGLMFDASFPTAYHVHGLPERAMPYSLPATALSNGTALSEPYRLYNLDVFEYETDSPFGLYGSIPLLLARSASRRGGAAGLFWLNAAEMYVDVVDLGGEGGAAAHKGTRWMAESGIVDVHFFLGPSGDDVLAQYARATGGTALPQLFALGYHQSRWNYRDEADVADVSAAADAHEMPLDVVWLDIEHTDGKRYLTWDAAAFPTPQRMLEDLWAVQRRGVAIVDPHVKRDAQYSIFSEAQALGHFVRDKDNATEFEGWCWPGSSSYLDVLSPEVRSWWAGKFSLASYAGSTPTLYVWNDMNEPSVFNGPEVTMHKHAVHVGGVEHRDVHNLYGMLYHAATVEGLERRGRAVNPAHGDRPFVLSRAFFAGTQRLGPVWTGDNAATWPQLRASLPMTLALNVAGLPFSGSDIGGFFGNPEPELLVRWYQAAVYFPFMRAHAHLESKRREPWLLDEAHRGVVRDALRRRYRLLPYLYTLFLRAHVLGAPVLRPLGLEFGEPELAGEERAAMLGRALLAAPVLDQGATMVSVPLPEAARWYDASTGELAADSDPQRVREHAEGSLPGAPLRRIDVPILSLADSPLFLRGGHIVPLAERARRSSVAMAHDPVTLVLALDARGEAAGELYLDDGSSYAAPEAGAYVYAAADFKNGTLFWRRADVRGFAPADAAYDPARLVDRLAVLGLPEGAWEAAAHVEGEEGGRALEVVREALLHGGAGRPQDVLVVRRARLPAHRNWTLRLRRTGDAGGTAAQ